MRFYSKECASWPRSGMPYAPQGHAALAAGSCRHPSVEGTNGAPRPPRCWIRTICPCNAGRLPAANNFLTVRSGFAQVVSVQKPDRKDRGPWPDPHFWVPARLTTQLVTQLFSEGSFSSASLSQSHVSTWRRVQGRITAVQQHAPGCKAQIVGQSDRIPSNSATSTLSC